MSFSASGFRFLVHEAFVGCECDAPMFEKFSSLLVLMEFIVYEEVSGFLPLSEIYVFLIYVLLIKLHWKREHRRICLLVCIFPPILCS